MGIIRVFQRNARVWRKYIIPSLVGNIGQPLMFLLAFGFGLSREIETIAGYTYLQFIAPGLAASAVMYSASFETTYGSYTRLSTQNTFEGILMTPISVEEVALGEILWGAVKGLLSGIIMLMAMPLFGVNPSPWVVALLPILFLAGIIFAALGLIMTSLAQNYEFFNYFISLFITPLFLFSGIFFSITDLSSLPHLLVQFIPLTPVVSLSRMLCYGQMSEPWLGKVAALLVMAVLSSWIATRLMRNRLIQ